MNDEFKTLQKFDAGNGREGFLHSLPELETQGVGKISRLPISIRIVLESVLRNCDGKKVRGKDVETLARWDAKKPANEEIPFVVARVVERSIAPVDEVHGADACASERRVVVQDRHRIRREDRGGR